MEFKFRLFFVFQIIVGYFFYLDGIIESEGENGVFNSGGGSGGSVLIKIIFFFGYGMVVVDGGSGDGNGGGGVGGCIVVYVVWLWEYFG